MIRAVLQILWSLWIEQCGVYFHPSDENLSPGAPGRKTPLDRIGSALHQLENRYRAAAAQPSEVKLHYLCVLSRPSRAWTGHPRLGWATRPFTSAAIAPCRETLASAAFPALSPRLPEDFSWAYTRAFSIYCSAGRSPPARSVPSTSDH